MSETCKKVGGNQWLIVVQENGKDKELFIQLPEDALSQMGWAEGDLIEWLENSDGSWTLKKSQPQEDI